MDRGTGSAGPLSAFQIAISNVCHDLGGRLQSIAEGSEQQRQNACRLIADLGQKAGEQARRLQDHQQRHQQHALAGFAVSSVHSASREYIQIVNLAV